MCHRRIRSLEKAMSFHMTHTVHVSIKVVTHPHCFCGDKLVSKFFVLFFFCLHRQMNYSHLALVPPPPPPSQPVAAPPMRSPVTHSELHVQLDDFGGKC